MTTTIGLPPEIDHPFAPAGRANPFPAYRWLQLNRPVHLDPITRMWLITSHADCSAVLRDDRFSATGGQRERARDDELPVSMLTTDAAEHQRLRAPGSLLLGTAAIRSVADVLTADIDVLLDGVAGRQDAVEAIGAPLATAVFGRLFGLPEQEWTLFATLARAASVNLDPLADGARAAAGRRAMADLTHYLGLRAQTAADCPLARLVADDRLSQREMLGILSLAVVGGWAPLAEMFGNALAWLLPRPDAIARWREFDDASARRGLDELLRLEAPIPFTVRTATQSVALPGGTVPPGARVLILLAAANRDPTVFEHPDDLVLDRSPNPHLAFGAGAHFCLGAQLVTQVGALALTRLVRHFPSLTGTSDELAWDSRSPIPRRLLACPVELGDPDAN